MFRIASEGTLVENNTIVNSDSGIRFGLIDGEHGPGRILNNTIYATRDVGISLENAHGVLVAHNTVFANGYPNAIEYRFSQSHDNHIVNNLLRGAVQARDNGQALVENNIEFAADSWFAAPRDGDARLLQGRSDVVDRALRLELTVDQDAQCEPRLTGPGPDIGANEFQGFADSDGSLWRGGWSGLKNFVLRLPNRVLYWGADYRNSLGLVALVAGACAGVLLGLGCVWWLSRRDRRRDGKPRWLKNLSISGILSGLLFISIVTSYLIWRHGPAEGLRIVAAEVKSTVYQAYMLIRAPGLSEPERHGDALVYQRRDTFELGSDGGETEFNVPIGIKGTEGLKLAYVARSFGKAGRVSLNAYDLSSGDNITAPATWLDQEWHSVVQYISDFAYNANQQRRVARDARLANLTFHLPAPSLGVEIAKLVVFRGPDSDAPSVPMRLEATPETNGVEVTWRPSFDAVGVARYVVSRASNNGLFRKIGEAVEARYFDRNGVGGRQVYRVLAVDFEDNMSQWSKPITIDVGRLEKPEPADRKQDLWFAAAVREIHARGRGSANRGEILLFGGSQGAGKYLTETRSALGRYRIRDRERGGLKILARELAQRRPEFCLILQGMGGGKDPQAKVDSGVAHILELITIARDQGVVPIVGTIRPRGFDPPQWQPEANFNAALIAMLVEQGIPVAHIFEEFMREPGRKGTLVNGKYWGPDGFEVAARAWREAVKQVEFVLRDRPDPE